MAAIHCRRGHKITERQGDPIIQAHKGGAIVCREVVLIRCSCGSIRTPESEPVGQAPDPGPVAKEANSQITVGLTAFVTGVRTPPDVARY